MQPQPPAGRRASLEVPIDFADPAPRANLQGIPIPPPSPHEPHNGVVNACIVATRRFVYIHGILNDSRYCQQVAKQLSELGEHTPFGKPFKVDYTCVPTNGILGDLSRVIKTIAFGTESPGVRLLAENLKSRIKELNHEESDTSQARKAKRVIVLAHSAGALVVQQVAKFLSTEEKNYIKVHAFGPAAILDRKGLGFYKVTNYTSERDIFPSVANLLRQLSNPLSLCKPGAKVKKIKSAPEDKSMSALDAHYVLGKHYQSAILEILMKETTPKKRLLPRDEDEDDAEKKVPAATVAPSLAISSDTKVAYS